MTLFYMVKYLQLIFLFGPKMILKFQGKNAKMIPKENAK